MVFSRKRFIPVLSILLLLFCLENDGQESRNYLHPEKEADSLASVEKHDEAVELYKSIIDEDNTLSESDRLRLEYKTGYSLMHSGRDIQAMSYFRNIITSGEINVPDDLLNDAITGLGKTYEYTGKHDSAFYWYMEAFKRVRESDDTLRRARGARNMAQLLRVLKRLDEAQYYCRIAVDLIPGIKDYKIIANIYNETAYLFELSDELDSAAYYYRQLIDLSLANGYLKGESVGFSNLASVFENQGRFREAIDNRLKGIEIDRGMGDIYGLMTSYRGLSHTYLRAGNYNDALITLDLARQICDTIWLPDLAGIMHGYYEIHKARGQYSKALEYYENYNSLRERINQKESGKQVAELLTRYETEIKEQQIEMLEQANLLNKNKIRMQWFIIGAMTLLGLFIIHTSWLLIRNKNHVLRQMNAELQNFVIRQEQQEGPTDRNSIVPEPGEIYKKWGLTERESEILYYLSTGCSNTLIGEKLFISDNTVKFHIKNIYLKLDVKNRIQALLRCQNDQPVT